jgi:hypothetical protein
MPRFVVLHHVCPPESQRGTHFDLMLECDGVLRTWGLADPPDSESPQSTEMLDDHRIAYLDYEGPISGGRGEVTRWDEGAYRVVRQSPDELSVVLEGARLRGAAMLVREEESPQRWRFSFSRLRES